MAIDSAEKRQNVTGVGRPYMRSQFPIATPDQEWRVSVGLSYGGNTIAAPASAVGGRYHPFIYKNPGQMGVRG